MSVPAVKPWKNYVCFFGQGPKNVSKEAFLLSTGMAPLDLAKASSCPEGISIVVVAPVNVSQRKVTPRILISARRRNWPVVSYSWVADCTKQNSTLPLDPYLIDYSHLQLLVKPRSGVCTSSLQNHCDWIPNLITINLLLLDSMVANIYM